MFICELFNVTNSFGHPKLSHLEFNLYICISFEQIWKSCNDILFKAKFSDIKIIILKLNSRFHEFNNSSHSIISTLIGHQISFDYSIPLSFRKKTSQSYYQNYF